MSQDVEESVPSEVEGTPGPSLAGETDFFEAFGLR